MEMVYDLKTVETALQGLAQSRWWEDNMPKLRSFVEFRDPDSGGSLVRSNLKRNNRSLLAKLVAGIMPLEIEVGRYLGIPAGERFCTICNLNLVEDEYHFLFTCIAYQRECSWFYVQSVPIIGEFMLWPDSYKVKWLLQEEKIKEFGQFVETLYYKRRQILYKCS